MGYSINKQGLATGWHRQPKDACGFTLIEALIAMVLLGFAITALLVSNQSFTAANGVGLELSTAEFIIEQVREATVTTPFASLVSSGPTNVTGHPGYSQKTTVQYVSAADLRTPVGSSDFRRITVQIFLNNKELSSTSWLRANY